MQTCVVLRRDNTFSAKMQENKTSVLFLYTLYGLSMMGF